MQFKFEGGDGDQNFFSKHFIAERVEEKWFPGILVRGPAYLLKIINGDLKGTYIAITSKVVESLDSQVMNYKFISVVVHIIRNPNQTFVANDEDADPIGMAIIEVLA